MNYKKCLRKFLFLSLITLPIRLSAQTLFSVPLDKNNLSGTHLYVDDAAYYVVVAKYSSGDYSLDYFKRNEKKIRRYDGRFFGAKFEGYSSNEQEFNIYVSSDYYTPRQRKVITFNKETLHVEVKDLSFPHFDPRYDDYLAFTHNNIFYMLFINKKRNTLKVFRLTNSNAEILGNHYLQNDLFKLLHGQGFSFVDRFENVDMNKLSGNKLYWRGDSLIFSCRTGNVTKGDTRKYLWLYPNGNTGGERVIAEEMKTSSTNEFLFDDKIFLIKSFYDSLVLDVKDYNNLKSIKKFKFNVDDGLAIRRTLFQSTDGDTLELRWKEKNVDKKIIRDFYESSLFISTEKVSSAFQLSFGIQTFVSYGGGGFTPGMGGAAPVYRGGGGSSPGGQRYFKACLSDKLEPIECDSYISAQDKANMRKNQLEKEDLFRFKEFNTEFDKQNVYLLYVDKELKTLVIEKF